MIRLQTTPRQLETLEAQLLEDSPSYNGNFEDRAPSESTSEIQLQINQSASLANGPSLLDDIDMNRLIDLSANYTKPYQSGNLEVIDQR